MRACFRFAIGADSRSFIIAGDGSTGGVREDVEGTRGSVLLDDDGWRLLLRTEVIEEVAEGLRDELESESCMDMAERDRVRDDRGECKEDGAVTIGGSGG